MGNRTALEAGSTPLQVINNYIGSNPAGDGLARPGFATDEVYLRDMPHGFSFQRNLVLGRMIVDQKNTSVSSGGRSLRRNVFGAAVGCLGDGNADCLDDAFEIGGPVLSIKNSGAVGELHGLSVEENLIGGFASVDEPNGAGIRPREVRFARNRFRGRAAKLAINANPAAGIGYRTDNDVDPLRELDSNRGLNTPSLASAAGGLFSGTVTGALTTRSGDYVIEVFASDKCFADFLGEQGDSHRLIGIGSMTVVDDGTSNGTGAFQVTVRSDVSLADQKISATATDADGNSSEFSFDPASGNCTEYVAQSDVVFADGFED